MHLVMGAGEGCNEILFRGSHNRIFRDSLRLSFDSKIPFASQRIISRGFHIILND